MYYDSGNWTGGNNGASFSQRERASAAQPFQYQNQPCHQSNFPKYGPTRMPAESNFTPQIRPPMDQRRNIWDQKMHGPAPNMQYEGNLPNSDPYKTPGRAYPKAYPPVIDHSAARMVDNMNAGPNSRENGRMGQTEHIPYSSMYNNAALSQTKLNPNQPAQGRFATPQDMGRAAPAGHMRGHQPQTSPMLSPPNRSFIQPRLPVTPSQQYRSYPAPPFSGTIASSPHRMSHQPTSHGSPARPTGPFIANPANNMAVSLQSSTNAINFNQSVGYQSPANFAMTPEKPDFRTIRQQTPTRPSVPPNAAYSQNYTSNVVNQNTMIARPMTQPSVPVECTPPPPATNQKPFCSSGPTIPDISTEFNLDSLLEGPLEAGGSFMQQLEDVVPDSGSKFTNPDQEQDLFSQCINKSPKPSGVPDFAPQQPPINDKLVTRQAQSTADDFGGLVNQPAVPTVASFAESPQRQPTLGMNADIRPSNNAQSRVFPNRKETSIPCSNSLTSVPVPVPPMKNVHPDQHTHGYQARQLISPPGHPQEYPIQGHRSMQGTPPRPPIAYGEMNRGAGMVPYPYQNNVNLGGGWGVNSDPRFTMSRGLNHPPRPDYGASPKAYPISEKGLTKRIKLKKTLEKNLGDEDEAKNNGMLDNAGKMDTVEGQQEMEQGSNTIAKNGSMHDAEGATQKKKKSKRPAATFKMKKKKKQKKGDEMDDFDGILLPSDNAEKRRSSRNVKRKQYVENFDIQLSDDMSEGAVENAPTQEQHFVAYKEADENEEETLIVEKVLDIRVRRVPKNSKVEKNEATEDPDSKSVNNLKESASSSEHTDDKKAESTAACGNDRETSDTNHDVATSEINEKHTVDNTIADQSKTKAKEEYVEVEEYFLKYKNYSYLHCEWKTREEITDKRVDGKIKRYKTRLASLPEYLSQMDNAEPFNPDFVEVERVLDVTTHEESNGKVVKHYFIKWSSLAYEDSTWENESDIPAAKIQEFEERCKYRPPMKHLNMPIKTAWRKLNPSDAVFRNGNQLRDYQLEGINWLLFNWHNRRNCILADEMGLGKTIQSITFLQKVFDYGNEGPFLVVAPLSTICNWQREFLTWTTLNAIVYHGSQISRDMIKTYEFLCRDGNLDEIEGAYKMHVVITTYEMIVLENSHLQDIEWKCLIIDEAHRLKNQACKLADSLRCMRLNYKVLLTGTPLQNNVEELFALLNFLQPEVFDSSEAFMVEFGNLKDNCQVEKLQELLKPMMLRRLKEDVEKSLAPKEETIIEVELTNVQKKYYRAILERNFEFLAKGSSSGNVPNLMNTMMELRKCCNHPYLIKGAEEKIQSEYARDEDDHFDALQAMIQSSGKLVLIDKLLPKLKSGGHKVLVFSQMVRCLDILEDYLVQKKYSYERIDGGVRGNERQMAIDRFSKPDSERFVFLLCTRAGGLGINLTAADTVIIFDSDWNPQNDLQAQARCHRIGQTKAVKIYRLITRNSYEREMFDKASLKLGLDKAVLQSISGRQDELSQANSPALSKQEVENLLKRGAYGAIMDEDDDSKKFCEEDIDQILLRRAHTITIAPGEKGSTFSKASFVSGEERSDISLNDPNFWEKWAKKADLDIDHLKNNKLIIEQPRHRKQTRRFGGMTQDVEVLAELGSDSDSDYDDKPSSRKQKIKSRTKNWLKKDYYRVEKSLLTFGWGRWKHVLARGGFPTYIKEDELEKVSRALLMYCLKFYNGDEKIKVFMWDLITPASHSTASTISNHEGLSAPVSRGRRGRQAKDSNKSEASLVAREWIKDVNLSSILQEDSFKKHLQHHCNKILLRVRMLYYLQTEILGTPTVDIKEISSENLELRFPDLLPETSLLGWGGECDKNLLIGVYKHGYGKYNLIRADPKLCFLKKFGMPDDKSLADDLDYEAEEDNDDPEYKPAKLNFSEFSEFEDSPASNTPGTAPASPASSTDSYSAGKLGSGSAGQKATEEAPSDAPDATLKDDGENGDNEDDKNGQEMQNEEADSNADGSIKETKEKMPTWPTASELNMRVRRIIASYQKQHKQIRFRLMNMDHSAASPKSKESREKMHWTRREEADFYRTVSTFGVKYDEHGNHVWSEFRSIAKLDKKSDCSLELYYLAFKTMCEQVCGNKTTQNISNISVTRVTEERASRTLYRIELLNRIRLDVLRNKKLDKHLELCEPSPDLPAWWKPGYHDKELLTGMDRHGVTRTEIHILTDSTLSFSKSIREYELNHGNKETRKRKLEATNEAAITDKKKKVEGSAEVDTGNGKKEEAVDNDKSAGKSTIDLETEVEQIQMNPFLNSQKWPKDRVLIQRVEHVCFCVINGRWPMARFQDDYSGSNFTSSRISGMNQSTTVKPDSKSGSAADSRTETSDRGVKMKLSSKVLELRKNHMKQDGNPFVQKSSGRSNYITHNQKLSEGKKSEGVDQKSMASSDALLNMCLYNSKISETIKNLLTSDLSASGLSEKSLCDAEKSILSEAMNNFHSNMNASLKKANESSRSAKMSEPEKSHHRTVEESSSTAESKLPNIFYPPPQKKKVDKILKKKKVQKSKTGFISPAVLPSDARIPVYNPSEKKKLTGNDAPLNKDLADWLKQHPGFVVDYKSLRRKLNEENQEVEEGIKPLPTAAGSKAVKMSKTHGKGEEGDLEYWHGNEMVAVNSSPDKEKKPQSNTQSYESYIQQSLLNLPAGLMNNFLGTSPEMVALLTSGILPGTSPLLYDSKNVHSSKSSHSRKSSNSSQTKREHHKGHSSRTAPSQPYANLDSLFPMDGVRDDKDAAALAAALLGYLPKTDAITTDPQKLRNMFQLPATQFDEKLLAANALNLSPFFAGMPGAINPLFYSLYSNPELLLQNPFQHPSLATSFAEKEFSSKAKKEETPPPLSELFGVQSSQIPAPGMDLGNQQLQKFMQTQGLMDPYMLSALGAMSSKPGNDFDSMFQSIYQQLNASHSKPADVRKEEKAQKQDHRKKSSQVKEEEPMDLTSSNQVNKK